MRLMFFLVLLSLTAFAEPKVWQNNQNTVEFSETERFQIISFEGEFGYESGVLYGWIQALKNIKPNKNILLKLFSGGGTTFVARVMMEDLREKCPECEVTSYVDKGAYCSSACVKIFLESDRRVMHSWGWLGFHAIYNPGRNDSGDLDKDSEIYKGLPEVGSIAPVEQSIETFRKWSFPESLLSYLKEEKILESFDMHYARQDRLNKYAPGLVDSFVDDISEI